MISNVIHSTPFCFSCGFYLWSKSSFKYFSVHLLVVGVTKYRCRHGDLQMWQPAEADTPLDTQCGSAVANILQYLNACFSVKWNISFLLLCHRNVHQKCLFCVCFTFFGDLRRVCFISQHSKILSGMFLRNYLPQEPGAYWILDKLQKDKIFRSSPNRSPPKYPVNRSMRRPQQCSQNDIQQLAIL